jgi:hypothetical protein
LFMSAARPIAASALQVHHASADYGRDGAGRTGTSPIEQKKAAAAASILVRARPTCQEERKT